MQTVESWLRQAPMRWGLGWVLGWSLLSVFTPIDASYDVLHYHLHNGWSAWNGRLETDLAPAGMHSYFNPLHNLIIHAMILALPGAAVTFLLGALQASVLILLYMLCRRLLASIGHDSCISALLLALAGFCSYSMLNATASIRNDHWIAAAFLGGLLLLMPREGGQVTWRRAALAAFIVGLSIGMKLTAVIHAAGIAAAVMIAVQGVRPRIEAAIASAAAGLSGILLTGGWWFWKLWSDIGNPVFPMMNGIFKSPFGPSENFRDERTLPDSFLDVLLFPVNGPWRFNEYNHDNHDNSLWQDLPIALLYVAILLMGVVFFRTRKPAPGRSVPMPSRALAVVTGGVLATLAVWFPLFAIGRYAMSIWMLGPLLFAAWLFLVRPSFLAPRRAFSWLLAIAAMCFFAGNTIPLRRIRPPDPWQPYVAVEPPSSISFENADVIFTGSYPSAFLAIHLPPSARYTFALAQEWTEPAERELNRMVLERVRSSGRPLVAAMLDLGEETGPFAIQSLQAGLEKKLGVRVDRADCARFVTSVDSPSVHWLACPLARIDD